MRRGALARDEAGPACEFRPAGKREAPHGGYPQCAIKYGLATGERSQRLKQEGEYVWKFRLPA